MAARQFDSTIFNNSIRKQRDSVMRFYFFLSAILIILHWKIAITSLIYSFHSTPNSRCFVYVHFQSHNAPNLPPLHISETGYLPIIHGFLFLVMPSIKPDTYVSVTEQTLYVQETIMSIAWDKVT